MFSASFLSFLKRSERIVISTGAGISEESGVSTFRGPGGLWNDFKPEEFATPEAFARSPGKVWEWYDWRRQLLDKISPNPAHYALVDLESIGPQIFVFTQNIDGLHQKAGSSEVGELHGNIWRVRCVKENKTVFLPDVPLKDIPPLCECGAFYRPDVVWFGETLPLEILDRAWRLAGHCDIFFVIGSSASVQPAASLAWVAKENGALVIEINAENTPVSRIADEIFLGKAGIILPTLIQALKANV